MSSLDIFALHKLAQIGASGRLRSPVQTWPLEGAWAARNGRRLLSFASNDYLGLREHPVVRASAIDAIRRFGTGSGASYLITGNHPLYRQLETQLAALKGTESACIFGSGYLCNIGVIPAMASSDDLLLVDELSHSCIIAGARLSGAALYTFGHNDVPDLRRVLALHRAAHRNALVITEGVFSMDGDVSPLPQISETAHSYDAWLMVDDAHGIGVLGEGRGTAFIQGARADVDIHMGTLSKALASYGGYVCASAPVVDLIRNRARSFMYSTALPPPNVAAASAAIDVIEGNRRLTISPVTRAQLFTAALGLQSAATPIVPLIIGSSHDAMDAAALLADSGFLVVAIRPPSVPEGTARLRLTFSAAHSDDDVRRLAVAVRTKIGFC